MISKPLGKSGYCIGLTGGIASGKTAVSRIFQEQGCDIIDTDIEARQVVKPNSQGLQQLTKAFSNSILSDDGSLNRASLRKIVFNDAEKLSLLNSILHPLIQQSVVNKIKQVTASYCMIVIPLLCETSSYDWLDRKLVVDVRPETQLKRLLSRDSITNELAKKMMGSQCSRSQRLKIADDVINNEETLEDLEQRVKTLHRLYKSY
ncbi:MAG: dephospho-CoA kinase [Proteobacteria bacterium]|nr:dephospho-CoA kinase [Pseudomonadota bacterium]